MRHELGIYSGLVAVGLMASYWASLPESSKGQDRQAIFKIDQEAVEAIEFASEKLTVKVNRSDTSKRFWVESQTISKKEEKPEKIETPDKPDADPHGHGHGHGHGHDKKPKVADAPKGVDKLNRFVANDSFKKVVEAFGPLESLRNIGQVDEKALKEFGLDDSTESVVIKSGGAAVLNYKIGGKSYGTKNVFVMNMKDKNVYLVSQRPFDLLRNATRRLYERKIMTLGYDEVESLSLKTDKSEKKILHTKRDGKGKLLWTDIGSDDEKAAYKNWAEKIKKLRVLSYADDEALEKLNAAPEFLAVQYESNGQVKESIKFKKIKEAVSGKADVANLHTYWLFSKYLGAWAKVSRNRVEGIEKDIPSIIE